MVTGPVTGGTHGWPFGASTEDLSRVGYVEEEYVVEGDAQSYRPVGELGPDGRWAAEPAGTARFRTRVLVQRPRDPGRANGTVVVGWNNVTAGYELLVDLPSITEEGFVYACASVQQVGIEGVGSRRQGLKSWDPERYGSLVHPGDRYSYGIFSQVASALGPRRATGAREVDPLDGLPVQRVVAVGASQSASRLLTYVDAVHPRAAVFDGFCVLIHFGSGSSLDDDAVFDPEAPRPAPVFRARARFRDDLDVPVFVVNSETETLAYAGARQEDTDRFRFWEVAGAAHVSEQQYVRRSAKAARDGIAERERLQEASHVSYVPAASAALVHLHRWMAGGPPPPSQPPIALTADPATAGPAAIERDEHGIALGGVRLPGAEVPVARESGVSAVEGLAGLGGVHEPFDKEKLVSLYGDHEGYVSRFAEAAKRAVAAGVLRPSEADQLVDEARAFTGFSATA